MIATQYYHDFFLALDAGDFTPRVLVVARRSAKHVSVKDLLNWPRTCRRVYSLLSERPTSHTRIAMLLHLPEQQVRMLLALLALLFLADLSDEAGHTLDLHPERLPKACPKEFLPSLSTYFQEQAPSLQKFLPFLTTRRKIGFYLSLFFTEFSSNPKKSLHLLSFFGKMVAPLHLSDQDFLLIAQGFFQEFSQFLENREKCVELQKCIFLSLEIIRYYCHYGSYF